MCGSKLRVDRRNRRLVYEFKFGRLEARGHKAATDLDFGRKTSFGESRASTVRSGDSTTVGRDTASTASVVVAGRIGACFSFGEGDRTFRIDFGTDATFAFAEVIIAIKMDYSNLINLA